MGPDEIRAYIEEVENVPTNTDDYPYLEYFVPGDLFYTSLDNVRELVRHAANPLDYVRNIPSQQAAALERLGDERMSSILQRRDPGSGF